MLPTDLQPLARFTTAGPIYNRWPDLMLSGGY